MVQEAGRFNTIDEYIAAAAEEKRAPLQAVRAIIRAAAPAAEEIISYNMPAFAQNGNLVYFAALKDHIGFYPTASGIEAVKDEIAAYESSKGAIKFPLDQPLPIELISKIVRARVAQNTAKAAGKRSKSKAKKGAPPPG